MFTASHRVALSPFLIFCLILLHWFWRSIFLICLSISLHLFRSPADFCLCAFLKRFFCFFLILIRCGGSKYELFFMSCSSSGARVCRVLSIRVSRWFEISWTVCWDVVQSSLHRRWIHFSLETVETVVTDILHFKSFGVHLSNLLHLWSHSRVKSLRDRTS